jgi:hypothetical protein
LSALTDAMITHIHHLVHEEHRPFSYLDFIRFEVDGQKYKMTHGTFRNNVTCLMKERLVEVSYKSSITFYTLSGVKFDKASRIALTGNHMGVPSSSTSVSSVSSQSLSSNPIYRIVRDLPLGKRSVHDLHLRFACPQIYEHIFSSISKGTLDYDYTIITRSKDILLRAWELNDLLIKITIHRTDIISVVVGCSLNPVGLDVDGVIRLTNALSVVEDRLSRLADGSNVGKDSTRTGSDNSLYDRHRRVGIIPLHSEWIVTMWHFGADASIEYSGEKFTVTWETAENVLIRAYSKVMGDKKTRIRLERQEYPRTTLADAIEQKISSNQRSGGWPDGAR